MKFKFPVVVLSLLLLGIYWQWLLPGPRVATDFSLVSQNILKSRFSLPQTWSVYGTEGLGEYTVFTLWSWQFNFVYAFFANLGLSFSFLERFLIIIPFLLFGAISIWNLLSRLNLSNYAKIIATFFYLSNTYILLVIDGGQLSISLSYAFFPICFLALENALKGNFKKSVLLGLAVSLMGSFDIRFTYVFALLAAVRFLFEFLFLNFRDWKKWFFSWVKIGFISASITIGLNFFWLYILYKAPLSSTFYSYVTQTSFEKFISLGHALFLLSPHWFKNVFGNVPGLKWEFIGIPLLVFLAPILKPKNRHVGFWLLVALISIFLTKGSSEPFSGIYPWFYSKLPGFSLFRDSSKFFFLIALSYTALLGITADEIIKRVKNYKIKLGLVSILISYLIIIVKPAWLGWMTGTFSPPPLQKEYSQLSSLILNDKASANIFWIPTISPLTILDEKHPAVEASRLAQKRPFAQATLGTYETFNFLREASYMREIFDVAGIGYIVYPYLDARRANMHPDNIRYYYIFQEQLSKSPWLSKVSNSEIPLYKVKKHQEKFFITPNIWWVIGSDQIYKESTRSANLSLAKNALVFAEESADLNKRIDEIPEAKIVLYHKDLLDLAANFIDKKDLIFPAKSLGRDPNDSGWWKREVADLIHWRDFLQTKYGVDNQDFDLGGGWAVGEGSLKLKVKSEKLKRNQILLARVLESSRGGQLKFSLQSQSIGQIDTIKENANIRWFEVGQLPREGREIEIISSGDINVINALALLDKNEWVRYQDKAQKLQGRIVNFDEKNASDSGLAKVIYQQINPTKYIVSIRELIRPAFLVFSQNYDGLWKMNGQSPLPVYSLLNGFPVEKDGDYIVEFEAQKYVYPGLVISIITIAVIITLLLKDKLRTLKI